MITPSKLVLLKLSNTTGPKLLELAFTICIFLKYGLSEKYTKFEKLFLMVLTNQLIYLVNVKTMRKILSSYVCFSKSPNFMNTFSSTLTK